MTEGLVLFSPASDEAIRERNGQDDKFWRNPFYYFELEVPQELAGQGRGNVFVLPLVLNPESITMSEPFAVQAAPTLGGGLFVEENGIVQRMLRIAGHTGFKPRRYRGDQGFGTLVSPQKRSFGREVINRPVRTTLSGQRQFQFLQDAVFRTYADLKRDPATAKDTVLYFHNPKDDEHWEVVPQAFTLSREKSSRVLYRYTIDLLVVDSANDSKRDFSEEKDFWDKVKDAIRTAQATIDGVNGAIRNVTALIGEYRAFVQDIGTIINNAVGILDTVADFVSGLTSLIQTPFREVIDLVDHLGSAIANLVNTTVALGTTIVAIPDTAINTLRKVIDGFHTIATHPESFETPSQRAIRLAQERAEFSIGQTITALVEAETATPPQTFGQLRNAGTALQPGDRLLAQAEVGLGRGTPRYTSAQQRTVEQGDTLPNLAARFLGDARLWRQLAVLNGLRPPYISPHGAPNTLRVGQSILIPTFAVPADRVALLATLGVKPEQALEEQLLGIDLALAPVLNANGIYDLAIDTEHGSTDAKLVRGVENLSQAIGTRIRTERGSDVLYRTLGLKRVIGIGQASTDLDFARFRVAEAVGADPRLASVRVRAISSAETAQEQAVLSPDIVNVDLEAEVRGLTQPIRVRVEV